MGTLTSTHNLCFGQKYEKYQSFLSENFQFFEVKFSIYLNRRVFVVTCFVGSTLLGDFQLYRSNLLFNLFVTSKQFLTVYIYLNVLYN